MRYLKIYENFIDQTKLKELQSHLVTIIIKFGFSTEGYIDKSSWETEFFRNEIYKESNYIFCIKLKTENNFIKLSVIRSLFNADDPFAKFIVSYLKTIDGIEIIRDEYSIGSLRINETEFKILEKDVDKIIKQITKEDMELKLNSQKYNI